MVARTVLGWFSAVLVAFLASVVVPHPTYGDNILAVAGSTGSALLQEGNSTVIEFDFTNIGDVSVTSGGGALLPVLISGDATDMPDSATGLIDGCIQTVAPGTSCSMSFTITTPSGIGETDNDSGLTHYSLDEFFVDSSFNQTEAFSTVDVTVSDPPPTTIPEPSSVVLLGLGVATVFGACRRRL